MKITVMGTLMLVAGAVLFVVVLDQLSRKLNANQKDQSKRNMADGDDQPNNSTN